MAVYEIDLEPHVSEALRAAAAANGRSVEEEILAMVEEELAPAIRKRRKKAEAKSPRP